jgi:L-ascorbate metabolism protein UlaG (beta-lactamase superfamily)
MKITYYGHSCFSLEVDGKNLLFDPFISYNDLASSIDIDKIEADFVLISHGHQDHIADAESILKNTKAKLISNYEIVTWMEKKGIQNSHPMNLGGKLSLTDTIKVKMVNAIHSSGLPDGSYGGNPGGFVIQTTQGNVYYAGDTALTYDMKLIAEEFKIKLAFLPIGDNFTMGISDAVKASEFIEVDQVIGMHYDTFPYIVISKEEAFKAFEQAGKKLLLPKIGESITL